MTSAVQLDMFPAPVVSRKVGGGPPSYHRMWERAQAPAVLDETLAILAARRGEWLSWNDFRPVIDRHQISSCFGHVMHFFVEKGLVQKRVVYFGKGIGAEDFRSPNYAGYTHEWSAV